MSDYVRRLREKVGHDDANGDEAAWVATIFEARVASGEPAPSDDETTDVGWFAADELDALPQWDATRLTLRAVLEGTSFQ
jgi:hypothetical protein